MKIYRLLLFFFFFAFIGQLGVTYSVNKKSSIEWSDADDDSSDTEDDSSDSEGTEEEGDFTGYSLMIYNYAFDSWKHTLSNHSNWEPLSLNQTELLFSIDHPPEIS